MKKKQFSEEQIVRILKEGESGSVSEVCRKYNLSENSFYRWRRKFGGMEVSEARRLKALETENARLKKLLAETMLDNEILRDVNSKNW